MKLAHLSDLHLGYGRGRRGQDVLRIFESTLSRVADLAPDLLVVSGDIFDHPNVTAYPIAVFSQALARLRDRLPAVSVILVAGIRDTPPEPGGSGPLAVAATLESVEVACTAVRQISVLGGQASVTAVPHAAAAGPRAGARTLGLSGLAPDPEARWNVLVAYASAVVPGKSDRKSGPTLPPPVSPRGWDYVALGSNHTRTQVTERVHFAGSLERVGPDPWKEAAEDKGFLTANLESGNVKFWPVEARAAVRLAPVKATGGGTATAARRLGEALAGVPGGVDGKLLRVPVVGLSPDALAALDREALVPLRRRVAGLHVEVPPSKPRVSQSPSFAEPSATGPFSLLNLQRESGGPIADLAGVRGLAGLLGDDPSVWDDCLAALRRNFARNDCQGSTGPFVQGSSGPVLVGSPAYRQWLDDTAAAVALAREECAAMWFGDGPVATWLSAATTLALGPSAAPKLRARAKPSADTDESVAKLRTLREQEAEARGDLEAGNVAWLRERQDAETRLLLYRDRGRELLAKLRDIEERGSSAACGVCGAPLGDRLQAVRDAGREEWESVVQDGVWWRRRRDQLESKPPELKALEVRVLALAAKVSTLAEELERSQRQERERPAAQAGMANAGARSVAGARKRVRALVHREVVALTGGRMAAAFPSLFDDWTRGGRRGGRPVAVLEFATRIVIAELARDAGVNLVSMIFPTNIGRLENEDMLRVLARLSRLARRIPLVLVKANETLAATAPECFDVVYRLEEGRKHLRIRPRRCGVATISFATENA